MQKYEVEQVPLKDLVLDPVNARTHDKKNLEAVKGSLKRFGQQKPIVIDKNNVIIAGNGTYLAAKELGWETINVYRTDLEGVDRTAYALADNRTAELAGWDAQILSDTLKDLKALEFDIGEIGFDESFLKVEPAAGLTDDDAVPENVETRCKPGDLWRLGEHRLLCGDATSASALEGLMRGDLADCAWTDPPYNVDYVGKTKEQLTIQNDAMSDGNFRGFLDKVYTSYYMALKPGAAIYVAHADSEGENFRGAFKGAGLLLKQCLIWVKNTLVMGRQDYHWKHEPILYGWREGAAHSWYTDRKQTTVIEMKRPVKSDVHPTMKPVELVEYCIGNSSKRNDVVLDLFLGSGSTLIACEKTARKCYGMEIDPHYCDVILKRWEDFTGKKAELLT